MRTVENIQLPEYGATQYINFHEDTEFLDVKDQFGKPVLFIAFDRTKRINQHAHRIDAVCNQSAIPHDAGQYLGTWLSSGGHYPLHFFLKEPDNV